MTEAWKTDDAFEDHTIKAVTPGSDGWTVEFTDGFCFWVKADSPVAPMPGMTARMFGKGFGYRVRGLLLDGRCVYYRTPEEDERHDLECRYGKDAADLLRKWDAGEPCWSVAMGGIGPGYEQAIQLAAFEMLRRLLDTKPGPETLADNWDAIRADLDEALRPHMEALGLSGAQYGAAAQIATMFYRLGPIAALGKVDEDRKILVSRRFPRLAEAA